MFRPLHWAILGHDLYIYAVEFHFSQSDMTFSSHAHISQTQLIIFKTIIVS